MPHRPATEDMRTLLRIKQNKSGLLYWCETADDLEAAKAAARNTKPAIICGKLLSKRVIDTRERLRRKLEARRQNTSQK